MGALGQHPIPTAGHVSRAAAVRAYDARWPGAPAEEVAWMLGCTVRDVWNARGLDRHRGPVRARVGRQKTPAERAQDTRARRRADGTCEECGEAPPKKGRKRCADCLRFNAERLATWRTERRAA